MRDFGGGLNEFVSPFLNNANECRMPSKNFDVSDPGKLKRGPGFTALGASIANVCKGLFVYNKEDGTHSLLKLHTTNLSKWDEASSWDNVTSGTSFTNNSTDIAYGVTTYTDGAERLYIVTGHNDYIGYYDGSAWNTNPGTINIYAKHIAFYKGRIYLGNVKQTSTTYPIRVLFSGIGTDAFDTTNDFFDDMGAPITGLKVFGDYLYVFTEERVARWDGSILTPIPAAYGTPHGRSVVASSGKLFWYNRSGIYMSVGGGAPTLISRVISPILEAIGSSTHVASGVDSRDRVYFWIGDITYQGVAYTDVVLRYDPLINAWDTQDGLPMNVMATRVNSGTLKLYGADTYTAVIDDTDSRLGSAFDFTYTTNWLFTDDSWRDKDYYKTYITTSKADSGDSQAITEKYRVESETSFTTLSTTFTTSESTSFKYHPVELKTSTGHAPRGKMVQLQFSRASAKPLEINEIRINYGTESRPD